MTTIIDSIKWHCKYFKELTLNELYAILQLRCEVFALEQRCYYQDMDDKDQQSAHLAGFCGDELIAYTRLLPPGVSYAEQSIGRVAVKNKARGIGLGRQLMLLSIEKSCALFGNQTIKIGAQHHLKKFYESLGFVQCSDIYDDAGIEHIKMVKSGLRQAANDTLLFHRHFDERNEVEGGEISNL